MNSFLIMDDEDMNFIWDTIQKIQIIFLPEIAPYGEFDFNKFYEIKRKKQLYFCGPKYFKWTTQILRKGKLEG